MTILYRLPTKLWIPIFIVWAPLSYTRGYSNRSRLSTRRSHWPRGQRRESAAVCLLGLWVRIPSDAWICVSCEYCVLSARGLFVGLITRPEESYRMWCVWVWSWSLWPTRGSCGIQKDIETRTELGNTIHHPHHNINSYRVSAIHKTKNLMGLYNKSKDNLHS